MKSLGCLKLFLLFILGLNFYSNHSFSQEWSHPITQGGNYGKIQYSDIYFVTDQIGWVIGEKGYVLKTTNGATSWAVQSLNSDVSLRSIFFINEQNGWVCGELGSLFRTSNSGTTWTKITLPGITSALNSIHFFSSTHGWICGDQGTILATIDGGITWQQQNSGGTGNLHSIHALSQTHVVATGATWDYVVTTDGGNTWTYTEGFAPENHHSIFFSNAVNGVLVGDFGKIQYSDNGGIFWNNAISNPLNAVSFLSVTMFQQKAWAVGASGSIVFSSDGGANWVQQTSTTNLTLRSVFAVNDQVLFAVGDDGIILKTSNGGNVWTRTTIPANSAFESTAFGGGNKVWACGSNGLILQSSNAGLFWEQQTSGVSELLRKIYFLNNGLNGWAVGDQGRIVTTSNGGTNWSTQNSGTLNSLLDIYFFDAQNGWAVGTNRTLLRTTNGGSAWSSINVTPFDPAVAIRSVFFRTALNGWLVTQGGRLARTIDGGLTWTDVTPISFIQEDLNSIYFESNLEGWVSGNGGTIMKTTDGGLTWVYINSGTTLSIRQIFFSDPMLGWAVGHQGLLLKSLDGGISWEAISSPTQSNITSIAVNAPNSVIVSTDGGIFSSNHLPITFYSVNATSPHLFTSWNSSKVGIGSNPSNFSSNQRYLIQPNHTMNLTGNTDWTITGAGTIHVLQNGAFQFTSSGNFQVPQFFSHGLIEQSSSSLSFQTMRLFAGSNYRVLPNSVLSIPTNAQLINRGTLILRSTSSGTGQLGVVNSGASITGTGTFTIERFIAGGENRRRFRFFGHPFQTDIALSQLGNDADEIDVTGAGGTTNGFTTNTITNNPSAFWYQTTTGNPSGTSVGGNTDPGWIPFTAANAISGNNAWRRYQGIRVLVRGTRGQGLDGNNSYTPGNATIRLSGAFNTGTQLISLLKEAQSGFNLVGNPYPSTINLRSVFSDASNASVAPLGVYVFNPSIGSTGAYQAVSNLNSADYFLPSMGAFFVEVNNASTLTIQESHKAIASSGEALFNTSAQTSIKVSLMRGNKLWDEWLLQDQPMATNGLELNYVQDVKKLFNESANIYSRVMGQDLAIDARQLSLEQKIPLLMNRLSLSDSFQVKIEWTGEDLKQDLFFIDRLRNQRMKVQNGWTYSFLSHQTELSNRFELELKKTITANLANTCTLTPTLLRSNQAAQLHLALELPESKMVQVQLLNMNGNLLESISLGVGNYFSNTWTLNRSLSPGVYLVRIIAGAEQITRKILVQ